MKGFFNNFFKKRTHKEPKKPKNKRWQISYIVILIVAYIIYSDRLNGTLVKCHLVAINPVGIYQGNPFIHSFSNPFPPNIQTSINPNHKSYGAEILRECSPPTLFHMSGVRCHMSSVTCHMSGVMARCHELFFFFFGQSGEASRWRVCYQQGLPRHAICHILYTDTISE